MVFKDYIEKILQRINLSSEEMYHLFTLIMKGELEPSQLSAILIGLRMKGETAEEIAGAARAMREFCLKVDAGGMPVYDTCGTGGDEKGTLNVSTAVSIALASASMKVAKHGNRSVSSRSGSADVLEVLGCKIELDPVEAQESLVQINYAFLFAPLYHPAMKHAMPVRKSLGVRTIFNILGPLTNPAGAKNQIIGTFNTEVAEKLFNAGLSLNYDNFAVACGEDGIDEITICGKTRVWYKRGNEKNEVEINPPSYGFRLSSLDKIQVRNAQESAELIVKIFKRKSPSPPYEFFLLNAGCAFWALGKTSSVEEGLSLAEELIKTGAVEEKLEHIRNFKKRKDS